MKIKQLLLLFVVMLQITSIKTIAHENYESNISESIPRGDEVFTTAAQMPSFPGGYNALIEFLSSHIRYPLYAVDNNIQGQVVVKFVIEKDGRIGEIQIVRGVDKNLDREAIRVCKTLPKFSPGRNENGDPVRVWYSLPITFTLTENENDTNVLGISQEKKWLPLRNDFPKDVPIYDFRFDTNLSGGGIDIWNTAFFSNKNCVIEIHERWFYESHYSYWSKATEYVKKGEYEAIIREGTDRHSFKDINLKKRKDEDKKFLFPDHSKLEKFKFDVFPVYYIKDQKNIFNKYYSSHQFHECNKSDTIRVDVLINDIDYYTLTKQYDKVYVWYENSAKSGNAYSMIKLCELFLENGTLGQQRQAYEWYAKAAAISKFVKENDDDKESIKAAEYNYNKATWGMVNLLECLENANENDKKKAYDFFNSAADEGQEFGKLGVAKCYAYGIGVEKDLTKAESQLLMLYHLDEAKYTHVCIQIENNNYSYNYSNIIHEDLANYKKALYKRLKHKELDVRLLPEFLKGLMDLEIPYAPIIDHIFTVLYSDIDNINEYNDNMWRDYWLYCSNSVEHDYYKTYSDFIKYSESMDNESEELVLFISTAIRGSDYYYDYHYRKFYYSNHVRSLFQISTESSVKERSLRAIDILLSRVDKDYGYLNEEEWSKIYQRGSELGDERCIKLYEKSFLSN